jgi:hypothetical protein
MLQTGSSSLELTAWSVPHCLTDDSTAAAAGQVDVYCGTHDESRGFC